MDELEILKNDWKKREADLPRLSYNEIYQMLWKKSSSIVKWIFVISIIELLLSTLLSIALADETYWLEMEELNLRDFTIGLYIVSYGITFYFIYRFYRNYQKISSTDDAATLMENIMRTRKTVKTYIAFVLISSGISALVVSYFSIKNHQLTVSVEETAKYSFDLMAWAKFIFIGFIALSIFLCAIWLFYKLIYGILLRKLNRNYRELKKLEV